MLSFFDLGTKGNTVPGLDPSSDVHARMNITTVAIIPVTDDVPLTAFG